MRFIDPHIHMCSRTTAEYEELALAGAAAVVEPAFWLGSDRTNPGSFFDYFNHLTTFEPGRAEKRGLLHYAALGVNPKEAEELHLSREVIAGMESYLERPTAIAVGEIGLNRITPNEEAIFREQVLYAEKRRLPVVIHTPHMNKPAGTLRLLDILRELGSAPELVEVDHNTEETIAAVRDAGYWAGFTIYPGKMTAERTRALLERYGVERMLVNSAADWEDSDPLAVPKLARLLLRTGFAARTVEKLVWDNPREFYGQCPKFKAVSQG